MRINLKYTLCNVMLFCLLSGVAAQQMGPQSLAQLKESPAGNKIVNWVEKVNSNESFKEAWMNQIFSPSLIEKFELNGLKDFMVQIREMEGGIAVYDIERTGMFDYKGKARGIRSGNWLDVTFNFENKMPYRIKGFGLELSEKAATSGHILFPVPATEHRKPGEKMSSATGDPNIKVDQKLKDYLSTQSKKGFSGAALVIKKGKTLLHKGYGLANREKDIPNTINTAFDIGSIMKDFTMVAILQLEEAGKLSTEDPLSRFFKEVPSDKADITVEQLLRHQSGLGEYHDTEGDFEYMTYEEAMKRIFSQELRFQPGTDQAYSNSGYTLLAAIIEKTSGETYMDYIQNHFIKTIGLKSAAFFGDRDQMKEGQMAVGYDGVNAGRNNNPYHRDLPMWQILGAGGLVMTLNDLHLFFTAIEKGKLLSKKGTQQYLELYNPARPTEWSGPVRGIGGGSDVGFTVVCFHFPEEKAYVLMASNTRKYSGYRMARPLAKILFGQEPEAEKEAPPFEAKSAAEWGLPGTTAATQAARFLNALFENEPGGARAFVKTHYHTDLYKNYTEEDHINFLGMVYREVQLDPKIKDIKSIDDITISFYILGREEGDAIKVFMKVKEEAPHQIFNILVGE